MDMLILARAVAGMVGAFYSFMDLLNTVKHYREGEA